MRGDMKRSLEIIGAFVVMRLREEKGNVDVDDRDYRDDRD